MLCAPCGTFRAYTTRRDAQEYQEMFFCLCVTVHAPVTIPNRNSRNVLEPNIQGTLRIRLSRGASNTHRTNESFVKTDRQTDRRSNSGLRAGTHGTGWSKTILTAMKFYLAATLLLMHACISTSAFLVQHSHLSVPLRNAGGQSRCASNHILSMRMKASTDQKSASVLDRRQCLGFFGATAAMSVLFAAPYETLAVRERKEKQDDAKAKGADPTPTITLKQFYGSLYAQEVKSVEFDGPVFEVWSRPIALIGGAVCAPCFFWRRTKYNM
jgi:hypothetical protein